MDRTITLIKLVACGIAAALIAELVVPLICDIVADLTDYIKETRRRG